MKRCSICKKLLPESQFYKRKKKKNWLASTCKECDIKRVKKYQKEHQEEVRNKNRNWIAKNRDKVNRKRRIKYQKNKKKARKQSRRLYQRNKEKILKRRKELYPKTRERKISQRYFRDYGITLQDKKMLLKKQNYKCAICEKPIKINANVDHSHKDRRVRGILCPSCNRGLGYFGDDIKILINAIKYLKK